MRKRASDSAVPSFGLASAGPSSQPLMASASLSSAANFGSLTFLQKGRHAVQGVIGQVPGNLVAQGPDRLPRVRVLDLRQQGVDLLDHAAAANLQVVVFLDHLPHHLEDLARHVVGGKLLQRGQHELVLAGVAANLQLPQKPLGAEPPQFLDRRLHSAFTSVLSGNNRSADWSSSRASS